MRGGHRTGAGRKKGFAAKNAEEARKVLSERVAEEIGPLSDMLISKAKKGDMRAVHELLDRAWGRPAQEIRATIEQKEAPEPSERIEQLSRALLEMQRLRLPLGMGLPDAIERFKEWSRVTPASPLSLKREPDIFVEEPIDSAH
jgi:hypothetical protein